MMDLAARVLRRDPRALARAATWIEDRRPEGDALLHEVGSHAGRALILGITGPPGAGKSTFCDQLTGVLRAEGKSVAILAVDPSSPFTGGAILGDRVRMQKHADDPGVFIRSMATRGASGGLAQATHAAAKMLDAAGFDVVLIETVGVGQGEIEVARLAQVTMVLFVPGAGDDVQADKAGLMEIADVFVVNKADLPGADRVTNDLRQSVTLSHRADGWEPTVVETTASEGKGLVEALAAARRYQEYAASHARAALPAATAAVTVDHIGVAVKSLDGALGFYAGQLGLAAGARETVVPEKVNVAMLPLGESRIELLEAATPDSTIAKFIEKRGEGIHHIALKVPDLNAAAARLRESGARLLNEPRQGAGGHTYVFVHPASTGGVLLELIQQ